MAKLLLFSVTVAGFWGKVHGQKQPSAIQATSFCDNPTLKAASALRKSSDSSASRPRRGAGSGAGRHHDSLRLLPPVAGASLGATFFFPSLLSTRLHPPHPAKR